MRITENNLSDAFLLTVNRVRERMATLQTQLATGRRVQKPSDDPQGTEAILRFQANVDRNNQYQKNIAEAEGMAQATSDALNNLGDVLTSVKDDATRATNGSNLGSLPTYANHLDQLLDEALSAANTVFNGKYLFGGTNTTQQPFTLAGSRSSVSLNPQGVTGAIVYGIADGVKQQVNIDGQEALMGTPIFDTIIKMRNDLAAGNPPSAVDVDALNSQIDHVLGKAAKAGTMVQGLQAMQSNLEQQNLQLQSLLSLNQDTDIAAAVTKLQNDQTMLNAALNTGARILPTSLVDFLK